MNDIVAGCFMAILYLGWMLGPIFGLWAAVSNGSFLNAVLSLCIPWYGMFYWFLA